MTQPLALLPVLAAASESGGITFEKLMIVGFVLLCMAKTMFK
jgi:hypothetical protein